MIEELRNEAINAFVGLENEGTLRPGMIKNILETVIKCCQQEIESEKFMADALLKIINDIEKEKEKTNTTE